MNATGRREARPSWLVRLIARAGARELRAFVVPGPEVARAHGVDLRAAGLEVVDTPRHASVMVLVGELPTGLKEAAAVAYAQMPRPRAILAVGAGDVSPLPEPDVSVAPDRDALADGVARLRRCFAENSFGIEATDFDVEAVRTQTEYACPMHPEVVREGPGSCPICGMDLVPREAASGGMDYGSKEDGGTDHGATSHGHAATEHDGDGHEHEDHGEEVGHGETGDEREEPDMAHEGMEHDVSHADSGDHEPTAHGRMEHDEDGAATRYVCPMHPEVAREEPGLCPRCGMNLRVPSGGNGAAQGHDGYAGTEHESPDGENGSHGGMDHGAGMVHAGHEGGSDEQESGGTGHEGMDHGDTGFMSMVAMTQGAPRSSDGLQMEWVDASFGPLFPGLPGGLALTFTLDGDTVARTETEGRIEGWDPVEALAGPAEGFAERAARLDPFSPAAYRLLALRAIEEAAGAAPDERTALARTGDLERERAASHLGWLASFAHLVGYAWLEGRAARLQLALLGATDAGAVARLAGEAKGLGRRVERTPLLRRKLRGIGGIGDGADVLGPVARAAGQAADARTDDEVYRSLNFEPVVLGGDDALSRLRVRLAEIEQSLDLVEKAGTISVPDGIPRGIGVPASGTGSATVETPRGAATLRATFEGGDVVGAELDTPSTRHVSLVGAVTEQQEFATALVGVASLDLSPWEVVR